MTEALSLFPEIVEPDGKAKLTAGDRLRRRHDAKIAQGMHPITGLRLRGDDETCGSCAHRVLVHGGSRGWPKCELSVMTHGPATDCLARFPACSGWEPAA